MPPLEVSDRFQDAVLWRLAGYDKSGNSTVFPAPVPLKVRLVRKQTEMLDPKGNTVAVDATAVVDRDIGVGSILWEGCVEDLDIEGTAMPSPSGLLEIKAFSKTPDVRGREVRRTIGLMRYKDKLPFVKPKPTSVSLTTSPNPATFGQSVTLTATVVESMPGPMVQGPVDFFAGEVLLGRSFLIDGVAAFRTSTLAVGGHSLIARYVGDQHWQGSTSSIFSQTVD